MLLQNKLVHADCMDVLPTLPENSFDLVLLDPPFSQTPLHWDKPLPLKDLWIQLNRVTKPTTPILIFGQEPFSSFVRMSNLENYKYDWYWVKERLTNVFQVKRRCGKVVETISVFYKKQCIYNPQKTIFTGKPVTNKIGADARWSATMAGNNPTTVPFEYVDDGTRHPTQILNFNRDNQHDVKHETQKPVKLLEYFLRTYTNEGMSVLDTCAGSGSTGVAAKNTNRQYFLIEKELEYFKVAEERLA